MIDEIAKLEIQRKQDAIRLIEKINILNQLTIEYLKLSTSYIDSKAVIEIALMDEHCRSLYSQLTATVKK